MDMRTSKGIKRHYCAAEAWRRGPIGTGSAVLGQAGVGSGVAAPPFWLQPRQRFFAWMLLLL